MAKRKVAEFIEDKLVAEVYEKIRESDGKRFYDTIIQRRYFSSSVEHRTNFLQLRDMSSIHILAVTVERFVKAQLWNNNNPGAREEPEPESEPDVTDSYLEA